jgi:long-chain acyl-CoA synthetase
MPHSNGLLNGPDFIPFTTIEADARRVASGLAALGVKPGDCVAILMRNDAPFLAVTYGVMRLGAYAVPLNWHFKGEEIAYILADCGARALFGHADLLAGIQNHLPAGLPVFDVPVPPHIRASYGGGPRDAVPGATDFAPWVADQPEHAGPVPPAPTSMIYTSGTTGNPKGVRRQTPTDDVVEKLNALRATIYGLKPGIRACLPGPLYHSAPNSFGLRAGRIGDLLVLMERFDAEGLLRLIDAERIDTIFMVPTMFIRLLKLPEETRRKYDVSSLRHIIHAAAPCPADVKAAMIAWWGPVIWEFYGGTESGPVTFASSADALLKPGTVGRASPGAELRILDENNRILPAGEIGEIYSRIDCYPDFTYHNNPEKRREIDRDGFITCGDIGYLDADGYLFISDRKRDMVISGGVNIYPAEIESVLHAMPGVHDCAVFGIPDADYGEALMAVVEPREAVVLTPEAIRAHLALHLANYKVPRAIEIRHGLPREDSGKIMKRRLRDPYWEAAGRVI